MIKKLIAVAIAGAALMACSDKVDRDGTRDNIVESLEASGFEVDKDCVDDALDKYSDEELTDIDNDIKNEADSAAANALIEELFTCATLGS